MEKTAILILIPFIAALTQLFVPRKYGKRFAVGASLLTFIVALVTFCGFPSSGDYQYVTNVTWIQSLGINFHVGMDGISMLLVLLTTFLVPLIVLSVVQSETRTPVFYSLILFMEFALIGVFTSLDGFLFYVFWELALIPIYFICLLWGGERRASVTLKFFIYTLAGSLFMLVGLVFLYLHTPGSHTFDIDALYKAGRALDLRSQVYLFIFFFLAFGIKMPVFPLHTWQPDTYTEAPTQGTMLLSGIMLKMGIYGVIRWILPVLPLGIAQCGSYVMWLAIIGVIYASIIAITRSDIKRLIAYSSIAHVGIIAAGIFFVSSENGLNINGVQGAMLQMLAHGVNVVGLFFIVDIIQRRTNTRKIASLGGLRLKAPFFATAFIILTLGAVALPLTDGFVGEFLLINSIYMFNPIMAVLGGLTIILGAVYMLRMYQRVVLGEPSVETENFFDLTLNEKAVLIPLLIMVILIGVCPNIFLKVSEPAVRKLLTGF